MLEFPPLVLHNDSRKGQPIFLRPFSSFWGVIARICVWNGGWRGDEETVRSKSCHLCLPPYTPMSTIDIFSIRPGRRRRIVYYRALSSSGPDSKKRTSSSVGAGDNDDANERSSSRSKEDVVVDVIPLQPQDRVEIDAAFFGGCKMIPRTTGVTGTDDFHMRFERKGDKNASLEALINAQRESIL